MLSRRDFLGITAGTLAGSACPGTRAAALGQSRQAPGTTVSHTFRAMTYNIHHGEGVDGRLDLERIAAAVVESRADLVALQEVDKGVERTARRDLPAELSALTGMACLFKSNYPFQGGEYGNAILTRFPVRRWTNTPFRMLHEGEQRGVLQAVVAAAGRELVFLSTHIDFRADDTERLKNVAQLAEVVAPYGDTPVLVGGDFNDTPGSRTHAAMAAAYLDTWSQAGQGEGFTIPSRAPNKRIDYLWLRRGAPIKPLRAWIPRLEASDHLPVVAEFAWE